jgi:hypothetical protein
MSSELRYTTQRVDDRYDRIFEVGYMENYGYPVTNEPFDMFTAQYWRYDKNIEQWVEGEIDEDGNWQPKE